MLSLKMRSLFLITLFLAISQNQGRKHHLVLDTDSRRFFTISNFGFYKGGFLAVNVTDFQIEDSRSNQSINQEDLVLGFTIDKTSNDALNSYVEASENQCILNDKRPHAYSHDFEKDAILSFVMNFDALKTEVRCSKNMESISILPDRQTLNKELKKFSSGGRLSDSEMFRPAVVKPKAKRDAMENETSVSARPIFNSCKDVDINIKKNPTQEKYNTSFFIFISNEKEEGLYSLYFHNCLNYNLKGRDKIRVSFTVDIEEKNNDSYLSAGEMPLPALYLLMAVLFFLSGCFWVFILKKNGSEQVFRIHWLMAALVYLKSLSLFFHGINYHKIETVGYHIESWAVLYYITHLLKGGLLFFTIVLIGSGWAFVKHILSEKEKRVFIIVLPLQILANVAYIIIEESEEGEARHNWWREIFILVDLLCCGAILFPVVWSIRHLQEASQTDGKATVSLEKLKLFRHFYIMVVCYIYFTRIIVYLLKITVPFQYGWLDEMFKEMATFVFFVMTGYKFRPASSNPYFSVPLDDYDMEEVLIGSTGINEQVTNRKKRVFLDDDDTSEDDEGMVFFPNKAENKESSHDLD